VFKQKDLDQRLQFDRYRRKSLIDHFYPVDVSPGAVATGQYDELGDFVEGAYEARLRRNPKRMQIQLTRKGHVGERSIQITKGLTLDAGSQTLQIAYVLEGLPPGELIHFGVEFNFSGLPAGCGDRYFHDAHRNQLGDLGSRLDLKDVESLSLTDEWLGIDLELQSDQPMHVWTYPIETVSQSEAGIELVHQGGTRRPLDCEHDACYRYLDGGKAPPIR
jgi:alpha-amylase